MPLEALENLASWVEANPDKVAAGVSVFMGAMDRNAEDRGAPSKDSKAQRRAKEKILTKAITQSPALLKDMVAKVKWGAKEVAGKKGVEKVAVQPYVKEAPKPGDRIRHRAPQKNVVPITDDHLVEGRVGKKPPQGFHPTYWIKHDTHTFHGQTNKVYKRDDLIDLGRVDPKTQMTNKQRMDSGMPPIGFDNKPINLHHTIQTQDGGLAEVTWTMHKNNHGTLHIWPNGSKA